VTLAISTRQGTEATALTITKRKNDVVLPKESSENKGKIVYDVCGHAHIKLHGIPITRYYHNHTKHGDNAFYKSPNNSGGTFNLQFCLIRTKRR
jgi:hypothetical protein